MIRFDYNQNIDTYKLKEFYCKYATWKVTNDIDDWNKIVDNTSCIVIAHDNEEIIASARALTDAVRWATIVDVLVHPKYRDKGIGSKLIKYLLSKEEMDVRTIYLATPDKEEFYTRLGFKTVNEHCSYMIKSNPENDEQYFLPVY